jgi:hypothetical protein
MVDTFVPKQRRVALFRDEALPFIDQRFEGQVFDEGARQGQPGVRHRIRVIEARVDPVDAARRPAHRKCRLD